MAQTAGGEFRGTVSNGRFRSDPARAVDGSQLLSHLEARQAVANILRREGREAEIPAALTAFNSSPVNERVQVAPGIEIIDWQTEGIRPVLEDKGSVPDAWALKTAYEFLACCIGGAIYTQPFEAHRRLLRGEPWDPGVATVELLDARHLAPMHGLLLEENRPYTIVQVRLFRRVCFRVHFRRIAVSGARYLYQQDLIPPNEVFAQVDLGGLAT